MAIVAILDVAALGSTMHSVKFASLTLRYSAD
jgi:hypothetical protein